LKIRAPFFPRHYGGLPNHRLEGILAVRTLRTRHLPVPLRVAGAVPCDGQGSRIVWLGHALCGEAGSCWWPIQARRVGSSRRAMCALTDSGGSAPADTPRQTADLV